MAARRKFRPTCTGTHPAPFGSAAFGSVVHFSELNAYKELAVLGGGQHGKVYHAQLLSGHEVAIKRFYTPEAVLDSVVHLLSANPKAFDHKLFPKTRAAFDYNGVFIFVQELCCPMEHTSQADRSAAVELLGTCADILLSAGISHCDIKFENMLWKQDRSAVLIGDLDSVIPLKNEERLSRFDGVGSHTQFVFGSGAATFDSFETVIPTLRFREFDYHLCYATVQHACMLLSCLLTAIELEPCHAELDPDFPPVWHVAVTDGCRLNMNSLQMLSKRHQSLFARFCVAWSHAIRLIATEPGAADAIMPRFAMAKEKR